MYNADPSLDGKRRTSTHGQMDRQTIQPLVLSPQLRNAHSAKMSAKGFVKKKIIRATKIQTNMEKPKRRETQTNNSC